MTPKDWLNQKFEQLRLDYHGRCWKCGSTDELQFAHIADSGLSGNGRGKKKRYYNIRNNPYCYALMCEPCHRQFDNPDRITQQ